MIERRDQFAGALLGCAIGDALGAPYATIPERTKEEPARPCGFAPAPDLLAYIIPVADLGDESSSEPLGAGEWTEDTQLMLALSHSLLEEHGSFVPDAWAHALARWANGAPRAPGASSLWAALQLRAGGMEWDEAADPEGGGAGPAARAAPAALLWLHSPQTRRKVAIAQASATHGNPDAWAAAVAVTEAIVLAASRPESDFWASGEAIGNIAGTLEGEDERFQEMARCLRIAGNLLADRAPTADALRALGLSGWSREAMPAALFCVGRASSFEEACCTATTAGGASDCIGAIAGAVAGARFGVEGIPRHWREEVEGADIILLTADRLYQLASA